MNKIKLVVSSILSGVGLVGAGILFFIFRKKSEDPFPALKDEVKKNEKANKQIYDTHADYSAKRKKLCRKLPDAVE